MTSPLRVGVIGLGPRWRRQYRPALRGLRDRFQITAVCDQVHERALRTAQKLQCVSAGGPTSLVERADVDAVLLLDPQWYGLWAAELACRTGKPVFCCPPATLAPDECESVCRQAEATGVPVLVALPLRVLPAAERLRELCATTLGEPRLLLACAGAPEVDAGVSQLDLLEWASSLFGTSPTDLTRAAAPDLSSLVLQYGADRGAQLTTFRATRTTASLRLEVLAESGRAVLHGFDRLNWSSDDGRHGHRFRPTGRNPWAQLLAQFHRVATAGESPSPNLVDLSPLLGWLSPGMAPADVPS